MPNRILKESITTSDTINELTPEEEVFFYRLLVVCDDYGRMDARPSILRAKCYPLKLDSVSEDDIKSWLNKLVKVGLIKLYIGSDNKQYLQVVTWDKHQQVRAKRSKYPEPVEYIEENDRSNNADDSNMVSNDINCNQMNAYVPENPNPNPNPNPNTNINTYVATDVAQCVSVPAEKPSDSMEDGGAQSKKTGKDGYTQEFDEFWEYYPRKIEKKRAFRAWKARLREGVDPEILIQACKNYAAYCTKQGLEQRYIKHASTFLGPDKPFEEYINGPPETVQQGSSLLKEPKSWGLLRNLYDKYRQEEEKWV
ncbi:hypothetical protein [Caldanaerobacter subterraneus]|uniref:Uncharacterized protein n=1 Tax=Caldanaerobacter subterraneus TaxID=911092 RepID=A0A7Y2L7M7_9THEO|nr:hypothetical protein [Caldanaerobacter subterraneus]NNG67323.1 hypothetical protein [Caldanaerobacter subterraneus]